MIPLAILGLLARAQQAINRFSLSTTSVGGAPSAQSSYKQARDARARLVSGVNVLYLLSTLATKSAQAQGTDFQPELLLSTLHGYVQNTAAASLNNLSRALSMLPTLERTLPDISARCQDLFALEAILSVIRPPAHPSLPQQSPEPKTNLLKHLLASLDASSLPSYFWRSLASSLSGRVQEIIHRGGVSARTLRSNRDRLKTEIRDCVLRGSQLPPTAVGMEKQSAAEGQGNWEREAAVMVSSVVGVLER